MSNFSQSPLIGSLSNLQVTRTGIKARTSSNLGLIGLFTLKLAPLSSDFFPQIFIMEIMMPPLFLSYYEFNLHQTYRQQGQPWNVGWVQIPVGSYQSLWRYMPLIGEKMMFHFSQSPFMRYLPNVPVTRTGIKARNELEFGPDWFIHFWVIRLWALNFSP